MDILRQTQSKRLARSHSEPLQLVLVRGHQQVLRHVHVQLRAFGLLRQRVRVRKLRAGQQNDLLRKEQKSQHSAASHWQRVRSCTLRTAGDNGGL